MRAPEWWFAASISLGGAITALFTAGYHVCAIPLAAAGAYCIAKARSATHEKHQRAIFVMRFEPSDLKLSTKPIARIMNIGSGNARNVDLLPLKFGMYEFRFEPIPYIQAHSGSAALIVKSGRTTGGFDVLSLMKALDIPAESWLALATKDHLADLTVPIVVKYLNDLSSKVTAPPRIMHVSPDRVVSMRSSERPVDRQLMGVVLNLARKCIR